MIIAEQSLYQVQDGFPDPEIGGTQLEKDANKERCFT